VGAVDLTVLGATGRTGAEVVRQALGRGHDVRALARSPEKAATVLGEHERLRVVEGDLLDAAAVERAVKGAEAVINAAGPVKGAPKDLQQRAIAHVLDAMDAAGVERLVTLTGAGVRHPEDRPKVVDRVFRTLLSVLQGEMLRDSEAYVDAVRRSTTRWTVVRAPRLVDAPAAGYRVAANVGSGTGTQLSRADLGAFLLDEVERGEWAGRMPVVSKA
jgi:putative NADH-flavin reductase